jgi:hypothetical protein
LLSVCWTKTASSFSASRCARGAPPNAGSTWSSSGQAHPEISGVSSSLPDTLRWSDVDARCTDANLPVAIGYHFLTHTRPQRRFRAPIPAAVSGSYGTHFDNSSRRHSTGRNKCSGQSSLCSWCCGCWASAAHTRWAGLSIFCFSWHSRRCSSESSKVDESSSPYRSPLTLPFPNGGYPPRQRTPCTERPVGRSLSSSCSDHRHPFNLCRSRLPQV